MCPKHKERSKMFSSSRDNWQRLVEAVLRRQHDWELAHAPSRSPSISTLSSTSSRLWSRQNSSVSQLGVVASLESLPPTMAASSQEAGPSLVFVTSLVFVNGHFIPDRVVKKAEKLAGPIQPGEYWYDITAGFWGVMGHPCLGIVMPNIEEFDYPMPEKCAAGNTGVFVNGRELNEKDLDLLASRGLPITKHRSYIIEISGKVINEDTGEELDGLGKLAPTVERKNHGFGMKVPIFIAQLHN